MQLWRRRRSTSNLSMKANIERSFFLRTSTDWISLKLGYSTCIRLDNVVIPSFWSNLFQANQPFCERSDRKKWMDMARFFQSWETRSIWMEAKTRNKMAARSCSSNSLTQRLKLTPNGLQLILATWHDLQNSYAFFESSFRNRNDNLSSQEEDQFSSKIQQKIWPSL